MSDLYVTYQYIFAESAPLLNSANCALVCVPWILIRVPCVNERSYVYNIYIWDSFEKV